MAGFLHGRRALRVIVTLLAIIGYLVISLAISSVIAALTLWAVGDLPRGNAAPDGIITTIGVPVGYGAVTTTIAIPSCILLSLVPQLRWLRAWYLAVFLANVLSVTAIVAA